MIIWDTDVQTARNKLKAGSFEMSGYPIKQDLGASIVSKIKSSLKEIYSFEVGKTFCQL